MTCSADGNRGDDPSITGLWLAATAIILVIIAGRIVCTILSGVPIPFDPSDRWLGIASSVLLGPGLFYLRRDKRLASPLFAAGLVLAGIIAIGPASDLAFYFGRANPMVDDILARSDRWLGFCWPCYVGWFNAHPMVSTIGVLVYKSVMPQAPLIVLALAIDGQARRVCIFLLAFNIALVLTSLLAYRFPALGAYTFWGLTHADHPNIDLMFSDDMRDTILWLRAGTFQGVPDGLVSGLISFPSFHAVTAAIYVWAAWSTRLRWPLLALNLAVVLVTPVQGSHYLVDVLAGLIVAAVSIALSVSLFAIHTSLRAAGSPYAGNGVRPPIPFAITQLVETPSAESSGGFLRCEFRHRGSDGLRRRSCG